MYLENTLGKDLPMLLVTPSQFMPLEHTRLEEPLHTTNMPLSKYTTQHTRDSLDRQITKQLSAAADGRFFKFAANYVIRNAPLKPEFQVGKEGGTLTAPSSQFSTASPLYQQ